jgi:hypothetical protein
MQLGIAIVIVFEMCNNDPAILCSALGGELQLDNIYPSPLLSFGCLDQMVTTGADCKNS